jgi:tetratricopeptide (TPR) repeat protein
MIDLSFLSLPIYAFLSIFVTTLLTGEDVVIEKMSVPEKLDKAGYNSEVVTRQFIDELREMNEGAGSESFRLEVDRVGTQKGIGAFAENATVAEIVNGARNVLQLIPYDVVGEIAETSDDELQLTIRIFDQDSGTPVFVSHTKGSAKQLRPMFHEAALGVMDYIDPYVLVLYYRQIELAAGDFDFPKTRAAADRYFASQPAKTHYLVYALLGRMHMLRAERDTALTPQQKQSEYDEAVRLLQASLLQHETFLYPYINLALIASGRGDAAAADQYFAQAVEINPEYRLTREAWGDLLIKENRPRDAVIQYVAAVEIDRSNAGLRDKLAQTYLALGRADWARAQWEEALRLSPLTRAYADSLKNLDKGQNGG